MKTIHVAAAVIVENHKIFAARRGYGEFKGYWEFPGGKLEARETPSEALARELAEELGIGVRESRFWQSLEHSYAERGFRVRLHFFHVMAFRGEPCPAEGQNLRWVTPSEALELGFLPADANVLEQLRAEGPATA